MLLLMVVALCARANAHIGPPFPIIENQRVGPCVISLWTHPDVGTGTFYVMVGPFLTGRPSDLEIQSEYNRKATNCLKSS